ncbi:hypothetical protein DEU56DRAFT_756192 [Suillus clintonianus]|uniref:uncharacterized protein n=1 Tax=Suillus clintonianus TaxID=1904413 RepID=UPI001B85C5A2|nr:uncharacterized protein DEU56DRAFT_756192 [Suillus clintonianus]KAG2137068.1 hypothetical protein DEU56DRAFT_756192 [Suillus clintonianus]
MLQLLRQVPLLTRERARSIQSGDVDMTLDENAPEDEFYNDNGLPDPLTGDEGHPAPPPDPPIGDEGHPAPPPDHPVGDEGHPAPPPDHPAPLPDPPIGDEGNPAPLPDPPVGDEDRRTIQDVDLDEIQRLASMTVSRHLIQMLLIVSETLRSFNLKLRTPICV